MSKNYEAVPYMTATAGQSSMHGWENVFKYAGIVPWYYATVTQPNSIEEGLAELKNQGVYKGPLLDVVTRVPIGSLPQWTPELAEQARQKVAWVLSTAQQKGIQIPPIMVPDYDPSLPMGAHPIDIERYIRWEQSVDMQNRFPAYDARLLPKMANGEVPQMEQNRSLLQKVTDLGQKVKERYIMEMNNNAAAAQMMGQYQQPVQQAIPQQQQVVQPQPQVQQTVQQPANQQVVQPQVTGQQLANQAAMMMGVQPGPDGQFGWTDSMKLWMFQHPKTSLAAAAGAGVLVFVGGRWVWKKTLGGDPEFNEEDAAALSEVVEALRG
jgi:hypothetical protein